MSSTVVAKNLQVGADGTASNNFTIYQPASPDGTLRIGNGNTGTTSAQVVLTSAGNVGIGTSSPGAPLDVNGNIHARGASFPAFKFANSSGTALAEIYYGVGAADLNLISNQTGGRIVFQTNGSERMRITDAGNVGIGTSSPGARSDVSRAHTSSGLAAVVAAPQFAITNPASYGYPTGMLFRAPLVSGAAPSNNAAIWAEWSADTNAFLGFATSGSGTLTERVRIDSSGNLLVGKTSSSVSVNGFGVLPTGNTGGMFVTSTANTSTNGDITWAAYSSSLVQYQFYVGYGGTVFARSTSISALSDQREKENIRPLETGLTEVMALQPRRFDWKNGSASNVAGFVAQEVQAVLPDLIDEYRISDEETRMAVKMGDILPTLVKAIQEQQAIIESLKNRIEALEGAA